MLIELLLKAYNLLYLLLGEEQVPYCKQRRGKKLVQIAMSPPSMLSIEEEA